MPKRYYTVHLKDGRVKRRIHDSKTGRIMKWEIATDLEEPKGEFKIVEWTMHFIPTRDSRPSSARNWEVRLRLPDGYTDDEIETFGREILADLCNEEMVETSQFEFDKKGEDMIDYSIDERIKWKVIDTARPQYKYPKKNTWGDREVE